MLSNCQGCKYFDLDWCAVNPDYWQLERKLRARFTQAELTEVERVLLPLPCSHWEQAMVPQPVPVVPPEFCYSRRPLQDLDEPHLALRRQLGSRPVRRKSWQERLFDAILLATWTFFNPLMVFLTSIKGKTLFILGLVLLAVSDPRFPGTLPGLPQIPRGYDYAQGLSLFVMMYQLSDWAFTIKRGEFASTKQMFNHIKFSLLLLLLLLGLMAWGGKHV